MNRYNILGISGSLRARSYNHFALQAAAQLMPAGMLLTIADYSDIPLYNDDNQEPATLEAVEKLRAQVAGADALLIASPEYNYSVTGVLKNAIDWLSRTSPQPFREKPVALMSATQGPVGGARNQYELRKILGGLEALVLNKPEIFIGMCQNRFDDHGMLIDVVTRKLIGQQMEALRSWISRMEPAMAR